MTRSLFLASLPVSLRRAALVAVACLLILPAGSADAQILGRIKKRAEEAAARRAEQAAERAVDKATGNVEGRATDAAGNAVGNAVGNAAGLPPNATGGSVEGLADFRVLQELAPASFAGLARTDLTGEATAAMGFKASNARAEYQGGDRSVTLTITDTGTMRAFLTMSAAWMGMSVDQQTSTGFTKTTTLGDRPAYLQESRDGGLSSSVQVVVADRFLVSAEADGLSAADVQTAVGQLDLTRLETLAAELAELGPQLVSFDKLIPLLPTSVEGFTRQSPTGETGGVAGLEMSQAEAVFTRGDEQFTVRIVDLGSLSGATALTYAAWLSVPVNRQTTEGFERTTRYGSHPAFEQQMTGDGQVSSDVQVAVKGRFLVSVEGNVPFDVAKAAAQALDLDALAALAEATAGSGN